MSATRTPSTPPNDKRDPYDGDYIGNIFGWKVSMIGAAVILLFVGIAAYRHVSLGVPIGFDDPLEQESEKSEIRPKTYSQGFHRPNNRVVWLPSANTTAPVTISYW